MVLTHWAKGVDRRVAPPACAASATATRQQRQQFLPFDEAHAVAQSFNLASSVEWRAWSEEGARPPNMPRNPTTIYKDDGWQGWRYWLGKRFLPFGEALAAARSLRLANQREWFAWCKEGLRPANVPSNPQLAYADGGWRGWGHWLGTGNQQTNEFLPFGEALALARSLELASLVEWQTWSVSGMRPASVPSDPSKIHKDGGWQGCGHWLGTGNEANAERQFLPFEEVLRVARSLRLVSNT